MSNRGVRLVVPSLDGRSGHIANRLRQLQAGGCEVVYVAVDQPYTTLVSSLGQAGVQVDDVAFLDTVSLLDGHAPPRRPGNVLFVRSPTMLEMIAMRIEQLISGRPRVHVVVDSLTTLALYNDPLPVQEFTHFLANRLRLHGAEASLLVADSEEGRRLQERLHPFVDGVEDHVTAPLGREGAP